MNQQAQMPDPQKEGQDSIEEYRLPSPYSWAAHPATQGVPREEPPHSYQEPMTPNDYEQGYSAQNYAFQAEVEGQLYVEDRDNQEAIAQKLDQTQPRPQRQRHGADGDALESGYQPHLSPASQQVPPWAKPQRHPRNKQGRIIAMLIVGLLLIKPLLILIALLGLTVIAVIILLLVLLPIVLLVLGVIALVIYNRRAKTNTANWGFQRGRGRYWHHQ